MAMRAAATVASAGQRGILGMLYSSLSSGFPSVPPQTNQVDKTPPTEPLPIFSSPFLDGWVIFTVYARPRQPPGQPENNEFTYGRR